jgi:L-alanine-DL-glutamate epimerase-like enolase superfamily enzyme
VAHEGEGRGTKALVPESGGVHALIKIEDIRERTIPLRAEIRNAWISFAEMDTSIVAVISNVARDGRPLVGFGFASNGRYAQGGILRSRMIPRLLAAPPEELADVTGVNLDPHRAWDVMMRNEKPGGHGERSVAVGVLDMAIWDLVAKVEEMPLHRLLASRYGDGQPDEWVSVYAAGGYYAPGRTLSDLVDEMRRYLDLGYTTLKMKIGGASLDEDLRRVGVVLDVVGSGDRLAVDANGRFDLKTALAYGRALEGFGLMWYEEAGDPLDFELQRRLAESYTGALATGENLFSVVDVRNLLRYAGMRPAKDVIQVDPCLSYGLVEYLRVLECIGQVGWSPRRCVPHGGHQFALHLAAGLHLGGNESYPGVFQPVGGFADGQAIVDGSTRLGEEPGIGIEQKAALYSLFRDLAD